MKKTVLSLALLILSLLILAQTPEYFNYQVVVRDGSTNSPLTNQDVSFRMSILKGSSSGISQYSELHSANTGALGIVNLVIGNGTSKTGDITTIDWGVDTYFLKVEIDKTGGSSYVEMGTTQLLSVPYALHAKNATTSADAVKLTEDQTIAGNKTFIGTITVPVPINATDAATKAYVDSKIPPHYIGELYGGGVVFWIDQTGNHGLICSMIDLTNSIIWCDKPSILIGATAQSDWDGQSNTNAIVALSTATSTADLCNDYTNLDYGTGTYSDWYLPSRGELNDLWNNIKEVQKAFDNDGNAATTAITKNYYWSSSEINNIQAWYFDFNIGSVTLHDKNFGCWVRAIRSF